MNKNSRQGTSGEGINAMLIGMNNNRKKNDFNITKVVVTDHMYDEKYVSYFISILLFSNTW